MLGLIAVFLANSYFSGVENRQARIAEEQKLARIVVANQDMGFGTPLSLQNLKLANWPANSVPVGAFTSLEDATKNGRVALRPIVVGEPVLASKVSGLDGRASLSNNLAPGKLAVSIAVNDVASVGGFVRPGDVVDVLLTRPIPGDGNSGNEKMTDVVMEAVPVLGMDQVADEKATGPVVAKTATLEVDSLGAQKLALASQMGVLSLALRNVTDNTIGPRATVIPRQLTASGYYIRKQNPGGAPPRAAPPPSLAGVMSNAMNRIGAAMGLGTPRTGQSMTIFRGTQPTEYEVKRGN